MKKEGEQCTQIMVLKDIEYMLNEMFDSILLDKKVLYSDRAYEEAGRLAPRQPLVQHVTYSLFGNDKLEIYEQSVCLVKNLVKQNSHAHFLVWRKPPVIESNGVDHKFYMRLSFATEERQTNI